MELDALVEVFRGWLHLPDPTPLYAVLASYVANQLPGDPLWLLLVGSPSSGKTELLRPLSCRPDVWVFRHVTRAGLLTARPDGTPGGLLGEIDAAGGAGVLVSWDFGRAFSGKVNSERRAELWDLLRDVYDGHASVSLGVGGGRTAAVELTVGLLGAVTERVELFLAEMGDLGPRLVLVRMPEIDRDAQVRAALEHAGNERRMRAALSQAVDEFLGGLEQRGAFSAAAPPVLDPSDLVALANWASWCRSPVDRDHWGDRDILLVQRPEHGARLAGQLIRLHAGASIIGLDDEAAWALMRAAALDSIPMLRRRVLDRLLAHPGLRPTTRTLADGVDLDARPTERILQDCTALGPHGQDHRGHSRPRKGRALAHQRSSACAGPSGRPHPESRRRSRHQSRGAAGSLSAHPRT
jgi:hypothetical protein